MKIIRQIQAYCKCIRFPLTWRGALSLALGVYLISQVAIPASDLIAYMVGGGLALVVGISLIITVFQYFNLKRQLSISLRFPQTDLFSLSELPCSITLSNFRLIPFFELTLQRIFVRGTIINPMHIVRGGDSVGSKRILMDRLSFPHRGLWEVSGIKCTIGDALGLTQLGWIAPCSASVEIQARTIPLNPLPIVAASTQSGDELTHHRERSGDPFDIKPYDKSDGVSRILWKTYAKTGALVVRRPEPAIVPEGEVAIFLIAETFEDHVAGALQGYLKQLEQRQITVLFGTDQGVGDARVLIDPNDIQRAINGGAWSSVAGTGMDLERFVVALERERRFISQIIIFASDHSAKWLQNYGSTLFNRSIKLTLAVVPRPLRILIDPKFEFELGAKTTTAKTRVPPQGAKTLRSDGVTALSTIALRNGAEVVICQSGEIGA